MGSALGKQVSCGAGWCKGPGAEEGFDGGGPGLSPWSRVSHTQAESSLNSVMLMS